MAALEALDPGDDLPKHQGIELADHLVAPDVAREQIPMPRSLRWVVYGCDHYLIETEKAAFLLVRYQDGELARVMSMIRPEFFTVEAVGNC